MDLKFYACPVCLITEKTNRIINLVNETTDFDGNIKHMPYPGNYLEQPIWYRDAVTIIRNLRFKYRKEKNAK